MLFISGFVSLILSCISRKKAAKGDRDGALQFGAAALYCNIINVIIGTALLIILAVYLTSSSGSG